MRSPVLSSSIRSSLLVLFIFIIAGAVTYFNALDNPFQHDDDNTVVNNVNIRSFKNSLDFFREPGTLTALPIPHKMGAGHYRPLVVLSYTFNYAIGGLNPVGYHVVNLVFHVGTAFIVFMIVKAIIGSSEQVAGSRLDARNFFSGLIAGLIFLVHPFNSESVNYVTARSSVMSGFFYLLAFYCWVKYRKQNQEILHSRQNHYIASFLAFAAGMLSKETVITLPVVIWLYDMYGFSHAEKSLGRRVFNFRNYLLYFPFILAVIIPYMLIRKSSLGGALPVFKRDLLTQMFTELPVLVKHWMMFFWPGGLSIVHDANIYSIVTGWVFLAGLLMIFYVIFALYILRLNKVFWRLISFFMLWFIIVLLPTTVIPLNAIFQENRGYLAIVSFAVIIGLVISSLDWNMARVYAMAALAVLIVVYSIVTINRNSVWGDSLSIWKDAVEKAPNNAIAYAGLSGAYRDHGDLYLSIETARKGISIDPDYFYLRINLGRGYQMLGDIDGAIREYEKALNIDQGKAVIWNDLAVLYTQKGDLERAEGHLRRAIGVWGDMPHIRYNLGVILAGQGRVKDAEGEFRSAVNINPFYFQARYELGDLLERLNRFSEAREQFDAIVRLSTAGTDPLSDILGQDRKFTEKIVEKARQRLARNNKL